MRNIYIAVLIFLVVSALLFVSSFFFLDTVNHKTFHYIIRSSGRDVGAIRIDRYVTEGKLLYKSVTELPFEPVYTEYRTRLVLDKKYNIESYTRERVAGKAVETAYLENFKNTVSFVSRFRSGFSCAENIPIKNGTFVFEEDSPVTYLPIIENYNFSRGRSQGFSAISLLQSWSLPPMKRFITFTSIKDEFIKAGRRRIKAENLILKIRDYPQAAIWVAKSDRSLVKIEIPSSNLVIARTFKPASVKAVALSTKSDAYLSRDISFKNGGVDLSGTLTFPAKEGRYPAVLLVPGLGIQDRGYQGLFARLADYLSTSGFVCLRFDKRGAGSSGGDPLFVSDSEESGDIESALQFLAGQGMVDPGAVFLLGHSRGAVYSAKIAAKSPGIRGIIMMAPSQFNIRDDAARQDELQRRAKKYKWNDEYSGMVGRGVRETNDKVSGSGGDWAYILGKKCFLGNMRAQPDADPAALFSRAQIPVLILQGKEGDNMSGDFASSTDKAIADSGNTAHTLTYYAYLGQYFGRKICNGVNRCFYDTDKEVLENVKNWLEGVLAQKAPVPADKGEVA